MRLPTVQQKLALTTSAGKGKSKLSSSSASGPLPARADTFMASHPPRVLQADSQFLTRESGNSPPDDEERKEEPTFRGSAQELLLGGVLPAPLETHVADTQTDWVIYFPMTLILDN